MATAAASTATPVAEERIPAPQQLSDKTVCCVCLENVFSKPSQRERRFGILSNCSHCYCLECIRTWRHVKSMDKITLQACPVCRTRSQFYIPSERWIENANEKHKLIRAHKDAMANTPCRIYDKKGGFCPFGPACFYKHICRKIAMPQKMQPWPREAVPGWNNPEPGWYCPRSEIDFA